MLNVLLLTVFTMVYQLKLQEFVVIGTEMDAESVEAGLRRCLLTDDEMKVGPTEWETLTDPFKEAWEGTEEGGHHHSHEGHAGHRHPH